MDGWMDEPKIETLDNWDAILRTAMLGCDETVYGHLPDLHCEDALPLGWLGAALFFCIVIFGAYVLPTVLIGIVAISFDDATTKNKMIEVREEEESTDAQPTSHTRTDASSFILLNLRTMSSDRVAFIHSFIH